MSTFTLTATLARPYDDAVEAARRWRQERERDTGR